MVKRTKVTYTDASGKSTFLKPKRNKNISEFRNWFEGQFGKRPSEKTAYELNEEINKAERALFELKRQLTLVRQYEDWDKAGHYAWFGLMRIMDERKKEPYPNCPKCGKNEDVIKNGTVERKGKSVQNWHCKECKKTW